MNEFINKVLDKKVEIKFLSEDTVLVNGKNNSFSLIKTGNDIYNIIYKNKNFSCKVLNIGKDNFEISLNNTRYKIDCKTNLEVIAEELSLSKSIKNNEKVEVFSPMPGLILKTLKNDGDEVHKGDPILILEAMKMENEILAPNDGIIFFSGKKEGDTIEKNTKLFEISNLLFEKK